MNAYQNNVRVHLPEEAVLAMPYNFAVPILNAAPTVARPLRPVEQAKAKKYLELCRLLLRRFPSDTMGRAVEFLLSLVENPIPGPLPPMPWFTTATPPDNIQVAVPRVARRLMPTMRFEVRFARRG